MLTIFVNHFIAAIMTGTHIHQPARLAIFGAEVPGHVLAQVPVVCPDGGRYRLFIARPRGDVRRAVYLLDGNAAFDDLTPGMLALVPGLLVVGVGYETGERFDPVRRALDYTPAGEGGILPDPQAPGRMSGGARDFLRRLEGPLREAAGDPGVMRTIWGHSFGGLCVLQALLGGASGFSRFVTASPSVWWDEARVRRMERAEARGEVLVVLGDREKRTGSSGPEPAGPSPVTLALAARLAARPGVSVRVEVLGGHGHGATLAGSLPLALGFAAG